MFVYHEFTLEGDFFDDVHVFLGGVFFDENQELVGEDFLGLCFFLYLTDVDLLEELLDVGLDVLLVTYLLATDCFFF